MTMKTSPYVPTRRQPSAPPPSAFRPDRGRPGRRPRRALAFAGLALAAGLALCSCRSYSISHSDPGYRGDLTEYQVVNSTVGGRVGEADIQRALRSGREGAVRAPAGSRVLLIQSGASTPDPALVSAMRSYYDVVPFTGVAPRGSSRRSDEETESDIDYARKMRLAAAQSGCRYIVCVWGLVDTNTEVLPTKMVSWTPIVGEWIPDERQQSRIRLRAAVIETASGSWSMVNGEPFGSERVGGSARRRSRTTWQEEAMKAEAFPDLAAVLARGA